MRIPAEPTIGRIVHYFDWKDAEPRAAIVCGVSLVPGDMTVNLSAWLNSGGVSVSEPDVPYWPEDRPFPSTMNGGAWRWPKRIE